MGYTTEELQVPVNLRINNLQAIMNELQNNLSSLKIGSKGFKDVENVLARIRNEMDKLEVQTSKPFINQRQFVTTERSIDKIEDGLSQAQLIMSRIKFSDLALNPEQTAQIKVFNDEITNIKNNIKNVKEITKQNFFNSDIGKAWLGIDPNAINQNLQQITTSITAAFTQQKKVIDEAEAKIKEYENAVSLKNKIINFTDSLKGVDTVKSSRSIFENIYDHVFNAQGKFQANGQTILARWLSEQFQLDEAQVSSLIQGTASKVIASLKSGELQQLITSKLGSLQQNTSSTYGIELKQQLEDARSLLNTLTPIYNGVANSQLNTANATRKFDEELRNVNTQLDKYKTEQAASVGTNATFTNAIQRSKQQLQQFKEQLQQTETNFLSLERTQRNFQSIKMLITNFMGFTQVLNLVKTGVRNALTHIKELDSVMNKIAIVTNLSNSDLWKQIDAYSEMSQKYGVSIKGAYEVSQIYYQQGLQTKDVLTLTNETLKLSKISGLDYAQTTDYMTTALRGFKMEMSEASTIVDVYSNLAAHTAVSQEELAVAMSKTASSLESVGATFQESSAMISTMVAVTRESATNIGSAMKSIAARYGEMKSNPSAISDIEGEAIAYNKVDTALQSVGISLKDTDGQFRNFTDVIIELGEKWDTLESTQQRYIATQFAGNRQQSRFLALISNVDLLKSNLRYAEDSEDVGDIQALKALDSIETKLEQVKVAYQEMYTTIGVEDIWKGALDGAKNFMNTLNGLPKLFGKIPVGAIAMVADLVKVIKDLGFAALGGISKVWASMVPERFGAEQGQQIGEEIAKGLLNSLAAAREALKEAGKQAADSVASGAAEQSQDKNTLAGKQQTSEQSTVTETAQTISEDNVTKIQTAATAGTQLAGSVGTAVDTMGQLADNANEVKQNLDGIAEAANNATTGLAEGIAANTAATTTAATKVTEWLSEAFSNVNLEADNTTIVSSMTTMAAEASDTLKPAMEEVGKDGSISIAQGLLESQGMASSAAASLATTIVNTLRSVLNMHSPSPTIIAMFENGVGEAIALGLEASYNEVESAASKLGLSVSEELKRAFESADKINLSEHFEEGDARNLARRVALAKDIELQAQYAALKDKQIHEQLMANKSLIARMNNIQYEQIPVDYVVASHNLSASNISRMAKNWNGQMASPSTAIKPMRDRIWSGFESLDNSGTGTFFLPRQYVDPAMGKAFAYPGDGYTPMLKADGHYPTITSARRYLDSLPEIGFDFNHELFNVIADATHLPDLAHIRKRLQYTANMPFYYGVSDDTGAEGEFRLTPSRNYDEMKFEQNLLQSTFAYYLKKSGIENYNPIEKKAGATLTGGEAFGKALYNTVDTMRKLESEGQTFNTNDKINLLRDNLYQTLLNQAKIDVPTRFEDKQAESLLSETLSKINFLERNPRYEFAEAKPKGNIRFDEFPGAMLPTTREGYQAYLNATQKGLNPQTTFFVQEGATSGPLSRESIGRYMAENIPGIAFNENGPLVTEMPDISMSYGRLWSALSNQLIDSDISESLMDSINTVMQSDAGPIFANTISAGLSSINFDSPEAVSQVESLISTLAETLQNNVPELNDAGMNSASQIIAGMAIGLSSHLAEATGQAEGAGQAIIAALNSGVGVASPSIFAMQSGRFIMLGLAKGMDEAAQETLENAMQAGKSVITAFDAGIINENNPDALENIKERFKTRVDALKDATDEYKQELKGQIDNWTLKDLLDGVKNPLMVGAKGAATKQGIESILDPLGTIDKNKLVETERQNQERQAQEKAAQEAQQLALAKNKLSQLNISDEAINSLKDAEIFRAVHGSEQYIDDYLRRHSRASEPQAIEALSKKMAENPNALEYLTSGNWKKLFQASNAPVIKPQLDTAEAEEQEKKFVDKPAKKKVEVAIEESSEHTIEEKIAALEKLRAAQEAAKGAAKGSDEYNARTAALNEARNITGLNLSWNSNVDNAINSLKEQANQVKTEIETNAPVVEEKLDTTNAKAEGEKLKEDIESKSIQQPIDFKNEAEVIAKGNAIRDAMLKGSPIRQPMEMALALGQKTFTPEQIPREKAPIQMKVSKEEARQIAKEYKQELEASSPAEMPIKPNIEGAEEAGRKEGEARANAAAPILTNTDKNVWSTGENGTIQTRASISELLDSIGKVNPAVAEAKAALLELFDTKPPADFVAAFNSITGAGEVQQGSIDILSRSEGLQDGLAESITRVQTLIDKLVELGVISEKVGEQTKVAVSGMSQSEVTSNEIAFLKMIDNATGANEQNPSAAPVSQAIDPAVISQVQELIDRLVQLGIVSEEDGAKLKASLEGATPEELTTKIHDLENALHAVGNAGESAGKKISKINFGTIGSAIRMLANISGLSTQAKGAITALGGAITLVGVIISMVDKKSKEMAATNPWMAIAMGVMGFINGISQLIETPAEKLERLNKEAEELSNKAKQLKSDTKELSTSKKQYDELEQKRYDSAEAAEEYQEAVENLTEKFPNLIKGFDEVGNAILDANKMEQELTSAREKSAQATYDAAAAELAALKEKKKQQIKTAAQAGDKLETYNPETGEVGAVHSNAYITYNKNAINNSMPEWMRSSHIANGANSLEADLYGGLYTPESLIGSWFYWMSNNVHNYWDVQGAESEAQQRSILSMFEGLAPYIIYSETGAESIDYAGAISYLEGIKDKTFEQNELLSFLKDFVQITTDIDTANTTNNGNTGVLKELVANGKITNEKIVARVLDESQASDDIAILNDAIKQYNTVAFDKNSTTEDIVKAYNYMLDVKTALDENVSYLSEWMRDNLDIGAVGTAVRELEGIDSDLAAAQTRLVASWFDTKYSLETFIKDSSGFKAIISQDMIHQAGDQDITTWLTSSGKEYADGLVAAAEELWTRLGDDNQESFKTMIADTKSYSAKDIISTFDIQDEKLRNAVRNYYAESSKAISERITKKLESDTAKATKVGEVFDTEDLGKIDTVAEERYFNVIFDNLDELVQHGYENAAESYRTSTSGLFDAIEATSTKSRAKVLSLLSENGITTKEGLNKTIEAIKNDETIPEADIEALRKKLEETRDAILSNLRLELQVATDTFLESWKDGSKTLSKLSSGIDIADVNSLIESDAGKAMNSGKGLTLDDFMTNGDKLVLKESQVDNYIKQYFETEREKARNYSKLIGDTIKDATWLNRDETGAVTGVNHEGGWTTTEIEELKKIAGIDIADYAKLSDSGEWVFETKEKQEAFNKAVTDGIEASKKNLQTYSNYLDWASESITKTRQWAKGDYSSLNKIYNSLDKFKELTDEQITEHLADLVSGAKKMEESELAQPDIGNAVKQIRSAYDTYISDLISKDIDTLYAEDYVQTGRGKAVIATEMAEAQNKTAMEFAQWIAGLADTAGQTIAEQNDVFIQAFDKIQSRNSLDGIQDVQFLNDSQFAATSSQLKAFADTYQLSISEMVANGLAYYDEAMNQWVVNYASLDTMGLDLSSIDGFKETVADSVNNFFSQLGNMIKSALDGSISNVEAKKLQQYAQDMGFEGKLDFTQTAEGLKLSEQSAISLYHCLEQTNSLQAQLVFKELRASLEESNEHYKTIASTQARIVELQNKIDNQDKPNDARIKQYEEELSLAKQIAAERATTEDSSFDFMNNDIPASQNNPITYYENWGKAWKTLQDSFDASGADKGLVGYKDFYNIITEMGHIAEVSGQPIKLGAETFVSDAESAAALIEKGAGCLTVATDGSIKVDLSKFGMDFVSGADDMASNVDDGIKAIAKSQIAMLDNMIKLLETIVAMEQLGNIDVDNDNEIDLGEIFKVKYDEKGFQLNEAYWDQFTENFQRVATKILQDAENNEDLATALKDVVVNGHSLHEMFQDAIDGTKDLDIDAQAYTAVMNAFYKAAISGDYDLDNIMQSVKDVLAGTGFEGTIEIGDYKLTYQYGVVLEEGKDGKYHVGDKTFDKGHEQEAARATAIDSLDTLKNAAKEINEETGEVTVTSKVVTKIDYDVTNKEYTIDFGDGYTATATSKAGADLAIATYAKLTDKSLDESGTVTEPVTFTLYQNGEVKTVVTLNDGEITVDDNNFTVNDKSVKDTAQQVIDKKKKEAEASAGQINDTVDVQGNLTVKVASESQITLDLTGKTLTPTGLPESIELTESIPKLTYPDQSVEVEIPGQPTAKVTTIQISKDDGFKVTGDQDIWNELVTTKEGQEFVASVIKLLVQKQEGFTNDNGETIWSELVTSKEGQQFIAYVSKLITKQGAGFTNDKGQTIWDLVDTESDPLTFAAQVISLITSQGESFTNDNGETIWSLVADTKEYTEFAAKVAALVTKPIEGYTNDEGESIWSLVKDTKEYEAFIASVKKLAAKWAEGASKEIDESQLGIPSEYTSPESITIIKEVNTEYVSTSNNDPNEEIRRTLYGAKLKSGAGYTVNAEVEQALGISHNGWTNHYKTENNNLKDYLTNLQQLVSTGQTLGNIDLTNLKTLSSLQWDDTSISTLLKDIGETNNWNVANLNDVVAQFQILSGMDATGLDTIATSLERISTAAMTLAGIPWSAIVEGINSLNTSKQSSNSIENNKEVEPTAIDLAYNVDITAAQDALKILEEAIATVVTSAKDMKGNLKITDNIDEIQKRIDSLKSNFPIMGNLIINSNAYMLLATINTIIRQLDDLDGKEVETKIYETTIKTTQDKSSSKDEEPVGAKGTIGLASGNAKAQGTLMGELGPELVVSGGRYFVVGQNGPEMVDLASDAIVFNHLQTKSLLEKGTSPTRGRAITNEHNAVSYAAGNVNGGPAMASASAALSALKQLRSQWQSLLNMSVKDLAGKGGSGGGGGGGSNNNNNYIKELEKWYNWLQKIDELEKDINMQEAKRNKIASDFNRNGYEYYNLQMASLKTLQEEVSTYQALAESQKAYFDERRTYLNSTNNPFNSLYEFDENGQLKYKDGALEKLSYMSGTNAYGTPNMTAAEQYSYITDTLGIDANYLKYDTSGTEIDTSQEGWEATAVQAFWDKMDADKEEMQSLHDSINEYEKTVLEKQQQQNEILKEIEDNQISVENRVLAAIEDMRQRAIDELQDQTDAIRESNEALINGLTDQLERERTMYENQSRATDLETKRRRLEILQRSGGSAAEIKSLQAEIDDTAKEEYFSKQQEQIDAIQEASNAQLEKLDAQIDLMEEQLEYEKEHGMLWDEVKEIMELTPTEITTFITEHDSSYWGKSVAQLEQESRQIKFEAEQWAAFFKDGRSIAEILAEISTNTVPTTTSSSSSTPVKSSSSSSTNKTSTSASSGGSGNTGGNKKSSGGTKKKTISSWVSDGASGCHPVYSDGSKGKTQAHVKNSGTSDGTKKYFKCSRCGYDMGFVYEGGAEGMSKKSVDKALESKNKTTKKAGGGYVHHGIYELGELGTETVLTASQTKILRDNILSNRKNSLISLLKAYNENYDGISSNIENVETNSDNSITIQHAEVIVHVDRLANSYDAARAGDDIMREMINIARKSKMQNRLGR